MTFARKPYVRKPQPLYAPIARRGTYVCASAAQPAPKAAPAARLGVLEQLHKARLVELGCMCCDMALDMFTPDVELHHKRAGMGWGKGDWMTLIPLCPKHHRGATGVHGLGTKAFPKHYGFTEQDMLDKALQLLNITPKGKEATE